MGLPGRVFGGGSLAAAITFTRPVDGALNTLTASPPGPNALDFISNRWDKKTGEITFDNSYPAGGYAVSKFGLSTVGDVHIGESGGYVVQYNPMTDKVQVFVMPAAATAGPLVEETAATDLHTVSVTFTAEGLA